MRHLVAFAMIAWAAPAFADARGTTIYTAHCARCHVVGQGSPVRAKGQSFIDITLAARQHDEKWLMAFMQRPTAVEPNTACHTKLSAKDAADAYRFLKQRLKSPAPEAAAASVNGARVPVNVGKQPKESQWKTAEPLPGPKPATMVHR